MEKNKDMLFPQGCEAKLEQLLQDVLSYAMLVILGFAIIKVHKCVSASSSFLFISQWIFNSLFCVFSVFWDVQRLRDHLQEQEERVSTSVRVIKVSWIPLFLCWESLYIFYTVQLNTASLAPPSTTKVMTNTYSVTFIAVCFECEKFGQKYWALSD